MFLVSLQIWALLFGGNELGIILVSKSNEILNYFLHATSAHYTQKLMATDLFNLQKVN